MELKPQELLVLLKVAAHPAARWTYAALAEACHLSSGEVYASIRRAIAAGLAIPGHQRTWGIVRPALYEFLVHGARYAFPAEIGPVKRGIPTAHGAPPLAAMISAPKSSAPVWAHPKGDSRGPSVSPIYRSAPDAALVDPSLHELLALLDALRIGRQRERAMAQKLLASRLGISNAPR